MRMIDEYQSWTRSVAVYPDATLGTRSALAYLALGLSGEAGEVANKLKKVLRGDILPADEAARDAEIADEIGDVLWYAVRLLDELGMFPTTVLQNNVDKLEGRLSRGVIKGAGDER